MADEADMAQVEQDKALARTETRNSQSIWYAFASKRARPRPAT